MKKHWQCLQLVGVVVMLVLVTTEASGQAAKADPAVQKIFDKLMDAIKNGNRDAFIEDATDAVKEGFTPQVMETLEKKLGTRLKKGYTPSYLCSLKQVGHQVYLWKLTFTDEGDDVVVRLALKDGKLAGFFLQ